MAKRFAISCFIVLGVCIFLIAGMTLVMFLAPGFSVFGIKYIASNTHVINKKYTLVQEIGSFSGSIIVETHEIPVKVYFTEEWDYRIEYYDNFNGITSSKIEDPSITISRAADGSAKISIKEYRRFLYESSSSQRYLKIFVPLASVSGSSSDYKTNLIFYAGASDVSFSKIMNSDLRIPAFNMIRVETSGKVNFNTPVNAKTYRYLTNSSIKFGADTTKGINASNYILHSKRGSITINRAVQGDVTATTDAGDIKLLSCKNLTATTGYGTVHSAGKEKVIVNGLANINTKAGNVYLGKVLGAGENEINTRSGEVKIDKIIDGTVKTTRGAIEIKSVGNVVIKTNIGRVQVEEVLESIDINSRRGNVYLGGKNMTVNNPTVYATLGRVYVYSASQTVDLKTVSGNIEFTNDNSEDITIVCGGKLKATNLRGEIEITAHDNVNLEFDDITDDVTITLKDTVKSVKIEALDNAYDEIRYLIRGKNVVRYGDNGAGSFTIREKSDVLSNSASVTSGPLLKVTGKYAKISLYMQNESN